MAQNNNYLIKLDFWLIDNVFQPIADRLPGERTSINLGLNLILGSVVFSLAFLILPLILYNSGLFASTYNILSCILAFCFYGYVYQTQSLIKERYVNPLRYHLFGIRIISLPFAFYGLYVHFIGTYFVNKISLFYSISNVLSLCGLYMISCNLNPPLQKQKQAAFSRSSL
ncbi:hypothetical protein COMNV_01128 [Commensalibacter sp. Nvir]|uniref:hypothetical protein n=1 Tax=Commensalibacter sp. Nvir TaxID=3069817 RepID=UPI002D580246|nr:hypothetical protein COMNV_01128 [Commensalibacter sp. Nvir]